MFLSAFCGLLDDFDILKKLPQQLHLPDGKIEFETVDKNGINCNYVEVIDLNENKDHGHSGHHHHGHDHDHDHSHSHDHSHGHGNHRHLKDIQKLIDEAHISDNAKKIAREIFFNYRQSRIQDS